MTWGVPPFWLGKLPGPAMAAIPAAKKIVLVTPEQLQKITETISAARCIIMADLLNKVIPTYGVTTVDQFDEFLATVLHESGEFNYKVENMNYSAATLMKTWKSRFPNLTIANKYARKPKELAVYVYGSRMGNRPGTDDGWNLRGSGFIGLTGRWVYSEYQKYKGFKTIEEAANFCRDSDFGALDSAAWFFYKLKNLMDESERDEMIGITKEVNGGLIGLKNRLEYYERCKKYLV